MPCLVLLVALISPRVAIVVTWLLTGVLGRAYDSFLLPLIGFFVLPWTTLAYVLLYDSGRQVEGIEWFLVVLGFLFDLAALFGGRRGRA